MCQSVSSLLCVLCVDLLPHLSPGTLHETSHLTPARFFLLCLHIYLHVRLSVRLPGGRLGMQTLSEVFKSGYSRIPIYGKDRSDIVGVMLAKDLIFIDPEVCVLVLWLTCFGYAHTTCTHRYHSVSHTRLPRACDTSPDRCVTLHISCVMPCHVCCAVVGRTRRL